MNGEIDLVSNTSITNKFMKSSSCRSTLQNATLQMNPSEITLFNSNTSKKSEITCSDFNFSSNVTTGIENSTCSENLDMSRTGTDISRFKSINLENVLMSNNSNPLKSFLSSSEVNDMHILQPIGPVLNNLDGVSGTQYCPASDHMDHAIISSSELIGFSKLALNQSERLSQIPDSEFRNKLMKSNTKNSGFDCDSICCTEVDTDYRYSVIPTDSITDKNVKSKSESKTLSSVDSNTPNSTFEYSGSNNLWNHSNCMFTSSTDHNTSFVGDPIESLVSGIIPDEGLVINDTQANGMGPTTGSVISKRAITGAHQTPRLHVASKPNVWTNTSNGMPNSTLGYFVSAAWTNNTISSIGGTKSVAGICGDTNSVTVSNITSNDSSQISWPHTSQSLAMPKQNSQVMSTMLGGVSYSNGNVTNTYLTRSPISLSSSQLSNSSINIQNNNKAINESGISNIYNMFPKRPQHRMMAHWQQQQQHHSNVQQVSFFNKGFNNTSNNLQVNGNQANTPTISSTNVATIPNNCNDNLPASFNGGCSVLQSLTNSMPSSSANSLVIGSAGDSFTTGTSFSISGNENSSLDNFKYGLDQQLMEVIKSFEISNIGGQATSIATSCTNNIIDDLSLSALNEMDPQLSALNNVSQLSVFGNSCPISNQTSAANASTNNSSNMTSFNNNQVLGSVGMTNPYSVFANVFTREEGYSRKVFVGGLPPDIDEEEITTAFRRFGPLIVDWPHKTESKAYFPPKGYCFLLFQDERSVQSLINACIVDENKYYWCVSSPTMKDKPVQIRPWNLADSDFVMDGSQPLDPRKTIFVGGVPRPLRAIELALIMDRLYGGVCYAGIDTDPELKYPKGAGRVAFSNQQSYIAAISARFVQLQHNEIDKRVEVKPYVLDNQMCDECQGTRCGGKFAPFFCANVTCLQYYCEQCWVQIHSRYGREYHKPLVKEGAERPRPALYRW